MIMPCRALLFSAFGLAQLGSVTGCGASYYLVHSRLERNDSVEVPPEVVGGHTALDSSLRVAIRRPHGCVEPTGAKATAPLRCGNLSDADMGEVERALSASGFEVIASDAVAQHAAVHQLTLEEAAQALQVSTLLRVATFEAASHRVRGRWQRTYRHADAAGATTASTPIEPTRADALDRVTETAEQSEHMTETAALGLEVTAENPVSSELFWFYRAERASASPAARELTLFIACELGVCERQPLPSAPSARPPRVESARVAFTARAPIDALRARALTELVADMARQLRALLQPPAAAAISK